jgi:hypothetical protein
MNVLAIDPALWVVLVMGGLVCALAWLFGRRLLVREPAPAAEPEQPVGLTYRGTNERRSAPRRSGSQVDVELRTDPKKASFRGCVLDRSVGGLGVLADQALPQGSFVMIRPKDGDETTWVTGTVRSCRKEGERYELGLMFHSTPNWSIMLQFG